MSIEISLTILALSSLFLTILILILIFFVIKALVRVQSMTEKLSEQAEKTLLNGTEIAEKIKDSIDATKPMFDSIAKIGVIMHDCSEKVSCDIKTRQLRKIVPLSKKKHESKFADILEFVGLGLLLWHKLKKGVEDDE
ncbi:MAG: hypothetical protein ACSNEK_03580 [Parachlamydiaceae bacterium]